VGAGSDGEPRYRMLETIREYGVERLAEAGAVAEVRRAHARYFRDLAEEAEPHLRRRGQLVWLDRLGAERDNILAALRFAADDGDADTAVRIAAALTSYWVLGGQHTEAVDWLGTVIAVPGQSPPEAYALCRIYHAITSVFIRQQWADMSEVRDELNAALAGPAGGSSHPLIAIAQLLVPMMENDLAEVDATMRRIVVGADPWVVASLHLVRGMAAENAGDLVRQRADLAEARARFQELGERWGLAATLNGLATIAAGDGDAEAALRLHDEALALMREINATDDADQTHMLRAALIARLGNAQEARALLEEILDSGRRTGSDGTVFMALYSLAELARSTGDIEGAWAYLLTPDTAKNVPWPGPPQVLANRDVCAAHLHLAAGDLEAARERLLDAFQLDQIAIDMPVLSRLAIAVGCYIADRGDALRAARVLGIAAGLRGAEDLGDQDRRRLDERLRPVLGDAVFDDAYAAGRATAREECRALLARILEPSSAPHSA
jgi:tetratricopeptide (TPR) repeat protein